MIHIVGLGPGQSDALTLGALKALKSHSVFLRTEKHPTVSYLVEEGISYEAFDSVYEKSETFDEVYSTIADLLSSKGEKETFVYGVPGHPLVAEKSVLLLIEKCKEKGIPYEIHPAVSFVDAVFEALEVDPINGFRIVDALGIEDEVPDYHKGTLITQVFSPYIASRVKIALNAYLNDEDEIFYIRAAGTEEEVIRRIPLYELDRQRDADDLTSVYVPPMEGKYSFYDFMNIVKRLRDKDSGCPWDKEQTHESLKPYLIEESYEALEAIDLEDFDALREELGDVMLQVLLHSAISEEEGEFNIHEVVKVVSEKMIYRHPHVFQKDRDMTSDEVLIQWEALKKKEKGEETLSDSLRAISKYYPGLSRAEKIQKKARKYGFDWDDIKDVFLKVEEELLEIRQALVDQDEKHVKKELGDLLFAVVNLARFLQADPEITINETSDKFIRRITRMEELLEADLKVFQDLSLKEMDEYWEKAKKEEKF